MAGLQDARATDGWVAVEKRTKALRTINAPRGQNYTVSGTSGTIAAAAAASSCFWGLRSNPSGTLLVFVEKIRFSYTTIAAYTTPVTAGRRLSLFRGSGAATTGGTALGVAQKDSTQALSQVTTSNSGDARIASTGALGVASIVWETNPIREMTLTHVGAAGGYVEEVYDFAGYGPIVLQPGQILGIRNPQAMDAAGTFIISVDCDFHESTAWSSTTAD